MTDIYRIAFIVAFGVGCHALTEAIRIFGNMGGEE